MKITQFELQRLYDSFNRFFDSIIKDNQVAVYLARVLGKSLRAIYYYGDGDATHNNMKAWEIPAIPPKYFSAFITYIIDEHKFLYGEHKFELNGEIDDEFCDLAQLFSGIRDRFIKNEPITKMHKDSFMRVVKNYSQR